MKLTIPIPEKVSLNKIYAGIHFSQRARHKDAYAWAVRSAGAGRWGGAYPVAVHYHFRLRGTRLDISNHAYMLKMIEDGLVACGVFPDDTPDYVAALTVTGEKVGKADDEEVVVTITPCASAS